MKIFKRVLLVSIAILGINPMVSYAQENNILDGIFIKETAPTRRVIPYTHIREADVDYYKRIWQELDLNEKINHPLYYPIQPIQEIGYVRMSLFDILKKGIDEGTLTAYEEDNFKISFTKAGVEEQLFTEIILFEEDLITGAMTEVPTKVPVTGGQVSQYRIKEDWVFDTERSIMEVRIIGIQPIINVIDTETGDIKGQKGLFWIYFPEARYVLANHEVFNPQNDGQRLTYEDLFRKRIFSSYIYQETNVYDNRRTDQYTNGIDRLLEANKIKQDIINYEHDLWQY